MPTERSAPGGDRVDPAGELTHAARRLLQAILGHAHDEGGADRADVVLVERRPHDQPVAARDQRLDREVGSWCARCDATHVERVADDHAPEAELLAQQVLQHARVQRRGLVAERRDANVRRHDRADARGDGGAERLQPRLDLPFDRRQLEMRVLGGRAVPREVLRARRDDHRSLITHHSSLITRHPSPVTRHPSPVTG